MPRNWEQRDKKLRKRRNADMVVSNRSIFVVERADQKRSARIIAKANRRARRGKYEDQGTD
jgi:hypothetical protein